MLYQQSSILKSRESNPIINKQLQKDLKQLIFKLQSQQIINLFKNLQIELGINSIQQFAKNGTFCSNCHIQFGTFNCKGYGRSQNQALVNAIKNIIQTMITSSYKIQNIKKALKSSIKIKKNDSQKKSVRKVQDFGPIGSNKENKKLLNYQLLINNKQNLSQKINETINLQNQYDFNQNCLKSNNNNFEIINTKITKSKININQQALIFENQQQNNCDISCIYYEIHKHSQQEIKNLIARIKLLQQQNSMLKTLLLKDFNKEFFKS